MINILNMYKKILIIFFSILFINCFFQNIDLTKLFYFDSIACLRNIDKCIYQKKATSNYGRLGFSYFSSDFFYTVDRIDNDKIIYEICKINASGNLLIKSYTEIDSVLNYVFKECVESNVMFDKIFSKYKDGTFFEYNYMNGKIVYSTFREIIISDGVKYDTIEKLDHGSYLDCFFSPFFNNNTNEIVYIYNKLDKKYKLRSSVYLYNVKNRKKKTIYKDINIYKVIPYENNTWLLLIDNPKHITGIFNVCLLKNRNITYLKIKATDIFLYKD